MDDAVWKTTQIRAAKWKGAECYSVAKEHIFVATSCKSKSERETGHLFKLFMCIHLLTYPIVSVGLCIVVFGGVSS